MFIVDRIEEGYVVVVFENQSLNIPLDYFKEEIHEGDVLYLSVDKEKTNELYDKNKNLLNKLFNKSK